MSCKYCSIQIPAPVLRSDGEEEVRLRTNLISVMAYVQLVLECVTSRVRLSSDSILHWNLDKEVFAEGDVGYDKDGPWKEERFFAG